MFLKISFFSVIPILLSIILGSCCSSKNTPQVENSNAVKITKVSLAPGTADIEGKILEMTEKGSDIYCRLQVKLVSEYGPSTPQLASNSEIEIQIPGAVVENEQLKEGSDVLIRISYYHTPMDKNNYWAFVKFN